MIPKDKLEQRVIQKIKEKVLTDENLEELVKCFLHSILQVVVQPIPEIADNFRRLNPDFFVTFSISKGYDNTNSLAVQIKELMSVMLLFGQC